MNATDTEAAGMNPEAVANDLTQLSSREQLSALMDGALPADQTRFLLRRLQHDAPLAECWQRWRLAGEVMRGLAPAQRLPADFALRVGAALHAGAATTAPPQAGRGQASGWLRWGGGAAALAASLAVVALMARQPLPEAPAAAQPVPLASAPAITPPAPPAADARTVVDAGSSTEAMAAATVVAAAAPRLARSRSPGQPRTAAPASRAPVRRETAQAQVAVVDGMLGTGIPQPDIVTRPWPRSVLPQYASGGLAVGFGEHARGAVGYNPFQAQSGIGDLPPVADGNAGGDDREAVPAPSPAAEPQP